MLHRTCLAVGALALAACAGSHAPATTIAPAKPGPAIPDPHSFARSDRTVVTHLALDLAVDFTTKQIAGTASLTVARRVPGAELILDTNGLAIASATECGTTRALTYQLGTRHPLLGEPLTIALPPEVTCVTVRYHTTADAGALLWVEPAGTAGKRAPMLFTQSQAILARTWVPLQDTPSVRFTYEAKVQVPRELMAVMSAVNPQQRAADGRYQFRMPHPIPSYLMALAVGDLAFRALGPRTGVYTEPSVIDAAAYEFAEVEAMVATAEKLYGPYRWGRYDMLVLPPSFPYGGMENPMLTFLTPTVITGDRALVSLIAHELAHSWAGNLVTNATWSDTWLNEGITTYVERRIMEELRGKDLTDLLWHLGRKDLDEAVARLGADSPVLRLAQHFGRDDDSDSVQDATSYEKGSLFMRTLEQRSGRARFDKFLNARFDRLAFQSTDSRAFIKDTLAHLGTPDDAALATFLDEWINGTAIPTNAAPATSTLADQIAVAARSFAAAAPNAAPTFDAKAWKTLEWITFLRSLPPQITIEQLRALDARYHLTASTNSEICRYWLPLLVARDERAALPAVDRFLTNVGRRLLVAETYRAIAKQGGFWLEHTRALFEKIAPSYHPVTRTTVAEILAGKQPN